MNKRYSLNGHYVMDNTNNTVVAEWGYDHAEFNISGLIYRITDNNGLVVNFADIEDFVALMNTEV